MKVPQLARRRRSRVALSAAAALLIPGVLAACGSSSSGPSPSASASSSSPALPSTPGAGHTFYVSLGDSYAAGYQPAANGGLGKTSTNGFAYQLASKATLNGKKLTLVNFACAGATTTSLLRTPGCTQDRLGPGAVGYPKQTQADAAVAYIASHKADVGLITVSISGNDITSCATASGTSGVVACVTKALATVKANLHTLLPRLRAAAPNARIVGLTYPDVILGLYVSKTSTGATLAALSVTAFKSLINPALKAEYDAVGGSFIDVTDASGGYIPFTQTTSLAPYGTIPTAVAKTCELTYYCEFHNIHPKTVGYTLIADLIRKSLPA
ncbi:MAG TPA: GDSL-type esterase/lipase family protein [Frankiaceae bacterium]|nr:GDSL-type esterase/lipase family protein [Frankiaceae bacterium]